MSWRKRTCLAVLVLWALSAAGCVLEEGVRDGIGDGVSAALASAIERPVSFFLDQVLPE